MVGKYSRALARSEAIALSSSSADQAYEAEGCQKKWQRGGKRHRSDVDLFDLEVVVFALCTNAEQRTIPNRIENILPVGWDGDIAAKIAQRAIMIGIMKKAEIVIVVDVRENEVAQSNLAAKFKYENVVTAISIHLVAVMVSSRRSKPPAILSNKTTISDSSVRSERAGCDRQVNAIRRKLI